MEEEKKNKFPWDTLETMSLMMPTEILVYHIYRFSMNKSNKTKMAESDLQILKTYLNKYEKESSVRECLKR